MEFETGLYNSERSISTGSVFTFLIHSSMKNKIYPRPRAGNKTGSHQDSQSLPLIGVIKNVISKLSGMLEAAEGPVANKEVEKGHGAQRFLNMVWSASY